MPKVFWNFGNRKKVEKWQFSVWKRSFSVCNTVLHLGILRLIIKMYTFMNFFQPLQWRIYYQWTEHNETKVTVIQIISIQHCMYKTIIIIIRLTLPFLKWAIDIQIASNIFNGLPKCNIIDGRKSVFQYLFYMYRICRVY